MTDYTFFTMSPIIHDLLFNDGHPINGVYYNWDANTVRLDFIDGATDQQQSDAYTAAQAIIADRDTYKANWTP